MRDLRDHWRTKSVRFEHHPIHKHKFNLEFYNKAKQAGFEPRFNENRPEEGYIEGVRLWDEDNEKDAD